jgi:hypothetical protein
VGLQQADFERATFKHEGGRIAALCGKTFHDAEMFDRLVVTRQHRNSVYGEEKYPT